MNKAELPIFPTENMTRLQRGRCHERFIDQALKSSKVALKEHKLKRKSRWLYRVDGYWFFSAFIAASLQDEWMECRAKIEVTAKPMALDAIYWHGSDLSENCKKPASFRCNAAFMLEGDTFPARFIEAGTTTPSEFAMALSHETADAIAATKKMIGQRSYSQFLEDKGQPKLQIVKYVVAMLADGRIDEAVRCMEEEERLFADPSKSGLVQFRDLIDRGTLEDILAMHSSRSDHPAKR